METFTIQVKTETLHRWREIAEREGRALEEIASAAAEVGTDALMKNGDQFASTRFQEDLHKYSATELAAMATGEFERPLS